MNKQFSKRLSLLMVLVMVLGMMPIFSSAQSSDLAGHWAGDVVSEWMSKGLISGYPDGTFKPDATMTRAEFMTIVNKVYNFTSEKDISFTDVKSNEWYYAVVKKAVAAGYISGYPDGRMLPNQPIQRQEVAAIFCKLESLNVDLQVAEQFKDIAGNSWAKGYIGAAVKAGYFSGYGNGLFKATKGINRAEAVVATNKLDNARAVTYGKAGTFGPATGTEFVSKSVVVKADGVILQNLTIKGDLTIDESVGQGTVTLNNVVVQGQTFIKGGGPDSIRINGGSYGKVIMMKTSDLPVRILALGVKDLVVEVAAIAQGGQVIFEGVFKSVLVLAPQMKISTQGVTNIATFTVSETALNSTVALSSGTVIQLVQIRVVLTVTGSGRIVAAEVTVIGVIFERLPEKVTNTVTNTVTENPVTTTGTGTSTGGSSSGGSSGDSNEEPTTLPVAVTPVSNQVAGYLASGTSIVLSTTTANASIRYTTDGSAPTTSSTLYTSGTPIILAGSTATGGGVTIKAIAVATNYTNSAVMSVTYYTQPSTASVSVVSGSAIFIFGFYGDAEKLVSISFMDALDDPNIGLVLESSTVKLEYVSGGAVVSSTAAVAMNTLGINVTSGSATFTSSGALQTAFGSFAGWLGYPSRVILHLEFADLPSIDIQHVLTTEEIQIITSVMQISANDLFRGYFASDKEILRL